MKNIIDNQEKISYLEANKLLYSVTEIVSSPLLNNIKVDDIFKYKNKQGGYTISVGNKSKKFYIENKFPINDSCFFGKYEDYLIFNDIEKATIFKL